MSWNTGVYGARPLLAALDEKNQVSISALRKRRLNRALYTRVHDVEAKLIELVALPSEKLVERCSISASVIFPLLKN